MTALMYILYGREKYDNCIEMLLNHGANVNIQNNDGETAIMYGIDLPFSFLENPLKMLLKHNANINIKNNEGNTVIDNAFKYAEMKYGKSIIDILLPNRKIFISKVNCNYSHKIGLCDFKIGYKSITLFRHIIMFM